ncbi:maleylpyruvate isomerase N-terminal domain-containing protein [Mycobacterium sp. ITM-2016-00317]|uniref:maleylpyruvate isomerase N-terminal domain-containing protein n=1 Tax=Mycobacterium sp. ITM-2016-00317 TaxID=2099694 RepID=UPI000D4E5B38|nr:maleylpyruvate isomerase N-terminal domain-containing protein [Mycobacterium sp. ITM-2016-00317]WNG85741.1 maleylpyruvate isomerase N-terminal domain-containing protein [Mycobacterium sp. ITM-2016-00317]
MTLDRVAAFRRERCEMLAWCGALSETQWRADSAAPGWRVQDVVAHLGASCRALFTPAALTLLTTRDIERANDVPVDARRHWPPQRVLADYERWSGRALRAASVVAATPARSLRTRLGELGTFRLDVVLPGALVFDHHTHLRHDLAPAVDRTAPGTDAERMATVVEWMTAVLANQMKAAPPAWLDSPVTLELHGDGGGSWRISSDGTVAADTGAHRAERVIRSAVTTFPAWATKRVDWRASDVEISGDPGQLTTLLDTINIV